MNHFQFLRYERGLTLREVVDGSGVSERTLVRLEQGQMPSSVVAKALADFYKLSMADFLGDSVTSERSAA